MPRILHIILDRDGVLNQETNGRYITSPEQWSWIPGVVSSLAALYHHGCRLSVATNQSCVGRGLINEATLSRIHRRMQDDVSEKGAHFAAVYWCPHTPDAGCRCRKPKGAMLERAIRDAAIEPSSTIMIGDASSDLLAARSAGVSAWLVRTGKGRQTENQVRDGNLSELDPDSILVFNDLPEACKVILTT